MDCVSKINTGAKYDSEAFKKSVGLNGVGTKAVNALSQNFTVQSIREGKSKTADFEKGVIVNDAPVKPDADTKQGTRIEFVPDETIFHNFRYRKEYVEKMVWNYCYLNSGLALYLNRKKFYSANGLLDLLLPLQVISLHQVIRDDVRQYFHRLGLGEDLADFTHGNTAINPIDDAAHALDIGHRIEPMPTFGARRLNQTVAPLPDPQDIFGQAGVSLDIGDAVLQSGIQV